MPEVRIDPLSGFRTIVASDRAARPGGGLSATAPDPIDTEKDPFLEGHEDQTPPETYALRANGGGPDLNTATDNGLARAAELLEMTVPEVRNRATIAGAIEIGRHPGVVHVTFRAPSERLEARGLLGYAREQYPAR